MNCIIIDDDEHCIETLTYLLENNFSKVNILASCLDATKAFDLINELKPDFIFLDIEMPYLNGFDLLSKFETISFEVIFTTAYDSYAIKAIKFSALDYLLKPVSKEELGVAIEKIDKKQSTISKTQLQMATAVNNKQLPGVIALPTAEGLTFAKVSDIIFCTADGSYSKIYMTDNSELFLSKSLGDLDELLNEYHFFRIHKSIVVNLGQVKKYVRGEGGEVIMSNGQNLQVARNRKADFLNVFTRL